MCFVFCFFFRRQVKKAMGGEKRRSKVRSLGDKKACYGAGRESESDTMRDDIIRLGSEER